MANQLFRKDVKKNIVSALQDFADIGDIDHPGMKGRIREIITEKLLRPILPPGVEIGNGKITDSFGNLSAESDIVIYNRPTLPPLLYGHALGLFPIEGCIYSIEIKSKLTASEIKDSIHKIKRLKKLKYREVFYPLNFIKPIGPPSSFVIPALFAFSTDLTGDGLTEINRYRKYDATADSRPLIPVFCIPMRGYWWFNPNEPEKKWIHHPPTSDFDEIIDFIAGIANTIPISTINQGQPYYGYYISEQRPFNKE
jgi:Domain of unknown function (DUF6602)